MSISPTRFTLWSVKALPPLMVSLMVRSTGTLYPSQLSCHPAAPPNAYDFEETPPNCNNKH